jgi:hypothetical protein
VAAGTADLTDVLANLSNSNCGAAYIGATLLCYCAFAAGPSGPDDLFLCHVGGANKWQNLVSGVRLVRESFQEDVLFAGLMSPMGPSKSPEKEGEDLRPICAVLGFTRANWRDPISKLAQSVRQRDGPYARVCLHSLDELASIYEGVYGDELGNCNVSADRRFVLGWLYRLDSEFVVALQCSDTDGLIILAHFAVLLNTMEREWWLNGWAVHLVTSIKENVGANMIKWPLEQVLGRQLLDLP